MIPAVSRSATVALGIAAAVLPFVYLPGIFEFTLLPRLFLLQALLLIGLAGWGSPPSAPPPSPFRLLL